MEITSHQQKVAIIILAAGTSKRMKAVKQLMPWGKTTLLGHSIEQATKSAASEVFVVLGANSEQISKTIRHTSVTILVNGQWSFGLGSSIAFAVPHVSDENNEFDGILLMLADQPKVDTHYLNSLINTFQTGKKQIIATTYSNGAGVPAIFDKTYFEKLATLKGDGGARKIIKDNIAYVTTITPSEDFVDIDTRSIYEQLYNNSFNS